MGSINWKVRMKNPMFWIGLFGTVGSTVLAYMGASASDLTTWNSVADIVVDTFQNPYLIGLIVMAMLSFVGVLTDPTTSGIGDSAQALSYTEPKTDSNSNEELE